MSSRLIAEQELVGLVSAARNDPTKREAAWAEVKRPVPGTQVPFVKKDR
jgi:hypothetical protein